MTNRSISALLFALTAACGGAEPSNDSPPTADDPRPPIAADQGAKNPVVKLDPIDAEQIFAQGNATFEEMGQVFVAKPNLWSCLSRSESATLVHLAKLPAGATFVTAHVGWDLVRAKTWIGDPSAPCVEDPAVDPVIWFDTAPNPVMWDNTSPVPVPAGAAVVYVGLRVRGETAIRYGKFTGSVRR